MILREYVIPKLGETRVIKKFLFFPKCLFNSETKTWQKYWLCYKNILQEYDSVYIPTQWGGPLLIGNDWKDKTWA